MSLSAHERLFGWRHAFDHPVTVGLVVFVAAALFVAWIAIAVLRRLGKVGDAEYEDLRLRLRSWLVLIPLMLLPVLLGAAWTIGGVAILSLLCYREFARATGLFRERRISAMVVAGILAVSAAVLDHWYGLFVALPALTITLIAAVGILSDEPKGYIQRVALGVFGFLLFGVCLGHLGYMANDENYRPVILMLVLSVELNDVFAYTCGKTFGRHKLAVHTSPNKTIEGSLGALALTTALVAGLGHFVFRATEVDSPVILVALGMLVSVAGQMGDLMLSSIKRDLGIKDMNALIPGHGGLLDRFDSLLLASPAVFHFFSYWHGFGLNQQTRLFF
ncbi:MAG: phosphatidate cytidylyltransferase [Candidatus Sumerlaeota bacterium]|nr:phosphatidate cytidylyltransferase [Candidatus Sumerlaeota bacterium]